LTSGHRKSRNPKNIIFVKKGTVVYRGRGKKKDLWIECLRSQIGIKRAASAQKVFERSLSGSRPEGWGSASKWYQSLTLFVYFRQREQEGKIL
jgi:hypothetical protein